MPIPAVVTAGDLRAAKAVYGESKVYLEIAGRPLVERVVATLQRVPEVSEVWVVGNLERLEAVFAREGVRAEISKPLHLLPQFRNLYENCWETYRRQLPGAGPEGRDPETEADLDTQLLYLSGDLPLATPHEISQFIQRGQARNCDFVTGMVTDRELALFLPTSSDEPGIEVACFNVREARLRQNNLHLVKPGRLGNRHYIEDMYEHRHQKEFGNMLGLAWTLLRSEQGGLRILYTYAFMHLAGIADRWRWKGLADLLRRLVPLARIEELISGLLQTRFCFVITDVGGCAMDVDTEHEFDVIRARFSDWSKAQAARAEEMCGPLPLPEVANGSQKAET